MRIVKVPGLSNIWVPPIRNRIDMLATGIKSPVGVKVAGMDLREVERLASAVEHAVKAVPGVTSAFAERLTGGRYIDVKIDRDSGVPLRPQHRRRSERRLGRNRRRQHRRDRGRVAAVSDQRALSARDPRFGAEAARSARPD